MALRNVFPEWSTFLRHHFNADTPTDVPIDVLCSAYTAAVRVIANPKQFPNADWATLHRLIEEMEANPEINNLMAEAGVSHVTLQREL